MKSLIPQPTNFLKQARDLSNSLVKMYSGTPISQSPRKLSQKAISVSEEVDKAFKPLLDRLNAHEAMNPPLYDYMKEQSKLGWNRKQFETFRDNFCHRTKLTIPSVADNISKAALKGDSQAVLDGALNLFQETGGGNINKMHSQLLLDCFNTLGKKIFGSEPIRALRDVEKSPLLIPEVFEYEKAKRRIFGNRSYAVVAGNTWVHELAADKMLITFKETLFDPYKGHFSTPEEYAEAIKYYTEHRDDDKEGGDIEAEHGRMAEAAAKRACANIKNIPKIESGALSFLDSSAKLWRGLQNALHNARHEGVPITPKPEFTLDSRPNPNPVKKQTENLKEKNSKGLPDNSSQI